MSWWLLAGGLCLNILAEARRALCCVVFFFFFTLWVIQTLWPHFREWYSRAKSVRAAFVRLDCFNTKQSEPVHFFSGFQTYFSYCVRCEWEWPCGGFKWVNLWGKDGSALHAPSEWSHDLISLPRSFSFPWHHLCSVRSLPYCGLLKQRRQRSLPISGSVCVLWLCASGVGGGAGNFPLLAAVAAAGSWASTPIQLSAPLGSALPPVRSALRLGGAGQKERERKKILGG